MAVNPPLVAEPAIAVPPSREGGLRLLVVVSRYFPYIGGVETHVYEVSRRLARRGVDVTILTTAPRHWPAAETINGVRIRRLPLWFPQQSLYFAPAIYPIVREGPWDLVHCQGIHHFPTPIALLAAEQAGRPCVVSFHSGGHSSRTRNRLRAFQWAYLRPLIARVDGLIAVSRSEAARFSRVFRLPRDRFVVIPNGFDIPRAPEAATAAAGEPGPLIVSVGRLERFKGHHRVLAALPALLRDYPDACLRILGGGPDEAALRQQARALGVADRVRIGPIPPTDRAGLAAVVARATLVTLLSEYEAHPIAILEALALGRPVLVANTPGLSDLAEDGLVRAIPLASTPEQVAAAMVAAIRQPLAPQGFQARTWDECAADLLALYRRVFAAPSA